MASLIWRCQPVQEAIARDPHEGHTGRERPSRAPGLDTPRSIIYPGARLVKGAVHERAALLAGIARKTPIWQFSMRPRVPLYWRCTPQDYPPFLTEPGLIEHQHGIGIAQVLADRGA
jgi:hypothetical protein